MRRSSFLSVALACSCSVDLGLPAGADISCNEDSECPEGYRCDVEATSDRGRCVTEGGNGAPTVAIGAIERATGEVAIPLTLFDAEGDEATFAVEVEQGMLREAISVSPTGARGDADGEAVTLTWDAAAFFGDTAYRQGLRVLVTPRGQSGAGSTIASAPFAFGNDAPVISGLRVGTNGVVSGVTTVAFEASDSAADPVDLTLFEVSWAGDFTDAVTVPIDAASFPGSIVSALTTSTGGTQITLAWDTGAVAGIATDSARIRLAVADGLLGLTDPPSVSDPFSLENAPEVTVWSPLPVDGRFVGVVEVPFAVTDPNLQDTVDLTFSFRVGSSGEFRDATPDATSDPVTALTPGTEGVFRWNAIADADQPGWGLTPVTLDTDGTASATEPNAVAFAEEVWLRATPVDSSGWVGEEATTDASPGIGNEAPIVTIGTLPEVGRDDVPIAFSLSDTAADLADVQLEFHLPGEVDADGADVWRTAAVGVGSLAELATATPATDPDGREHVVTWASATPSADEPTAAQGVGRQAIDGVGLRLRGIDHVGGVDAYGPWAVATLPHLGNQTPPMAQIVGLKPLDGDGQSHGPIEILVKLFDDESDLVDLQIDFSMDETHWYPCTESATVWSEGRYDLASAPVADGGVTHRFLWDSCADLVVERDDVWLRVLPADDTSQGTGDVTFDPISAGPASGKSLFAAAASPTEAGTGVTRPLTWLDSGDLNGDGNDDLVALYSAVDLGTGELRIYLSDGAGGFVLSESHDTGPRSETLALLQLDPTPGAPLDVVVPSRTDGQLYLFDGDGDGTFSGPSLVATIDNSYHAASGDFDHDGNPDLVVSRFAWFNDFAGIQFGDGSGGFTAVYDYETPESPTKNLVADLNGDGWDDWAVLHYFSNEFGFFILDLFINNRTGMRSDLFAKSSIDMTIPCQDLLATDLSGDAIPDLVVMSSLGAVMVLLGNPDPGDPLHGDGTFSTPRVGAVVSIGGTLAAGDFDDDGAVDIAVSQPTTIAVLLGTGDAEGGLKPPAYLPRLATDAGPMAAGDLNGDGFEDLVLAESVPDPANSTFDDRLHPWLGGSLRDSLVQLAAPVTFPTYVWPEDAELADFNADGFLDLLTVTGTNSVASILFGQGERGLGNGLFGPQTIYAGYWQDAACTVSDLNGDGILDITSTSATMLTRLGLGSDGIGDGTFASASSWGGMHRTFTQLAADVDLDGDIDLAGIGQYPDAHDVGWRATIPGNLLLWMNDGTGSFALTQLSADNVDNDSNLRGGLACGDLNGDFTPDLAVAGGRGQLVKVLLADPSAPGTFPTEITSDTGQYGATQLALGDFNGDGVLDLAVAMDDQVGLMLGEAAAPGVGSGSFATPSPIQLGGRVSHLAVADLNGDGALDLVAVTAGGGAILRGNLTAGVPNGTLASPIGLPIGGVPNAVAIGDVNADSVLDVVLMIDNGNAGVFLGQDSGAQSRSVALAPYAPATGTGNWLGAPAEAMADRFHAWRDWRLTFRRFASPLAEAPGDRRLGDETADFRDLLRWEGMRPDAAVAPPAALIPLTDAWTASGALRWHTIPHETGSNLRYRREPRLGAVTDPVAAIPSAREGLSLAAGRGVIVDLPIPEGRSVDDNTVVRVFGRVSAFWSATEVTNDPANGLSEASDLLPQLDRGAGYADVVVERYAWVEVGERNETDFAGATTPGFIVDVASRRVRVLVDTLGTYQAFVVP